MPFKRLDQELLDDIARQARETPRLRKNYNFHDHAERVQRFINVLQPGTYVRPHRHLRPPGVNGFEFFLVLQGEIGMLLFTQTGDLVQREHLTADGPLRGIELAEGTYHSLVALSPDTVMIEIKEGPYDQPRDKEFLDQFPPEGTAEAVRLAHTWQALFQTPDKHPGATSPNA